MPVYPTEAEVRAQEPWADLTLEEKKILLMRLSQNEVGELLGLGQPRVSQLTSENVLHRGRDGKYVLREVARDYFNYLEGRFQDLRTPRRRY